jgi:hypothetical protein
MVGWDEHHMRGYSEKEDSCSDRGSSLPGRMEHGTSGE